jgi:hypothetical protein
MIPLTRSRRGAGCHFPGRAHLLEGNGVKLVRSLAGRGPSTSLRVACPEPVEGLRANGVGEKHREISVRAERSRAGGEVEARGRILNLRPLPLEGRLICTTLVDVRRLSIAGYEKVCLARLTAAISGACEHLCCLDLRGQV